LKKIADLIHSSALSFIESILASYTSDIVIRFADFPEMRSKEEAKRFLVARFARQKNYQLQKTLRMVMGNMIGNSWILHCLPFLIMFSSSIWVGLLTSRNTSLVVKDTWG
jgi:hypothetical protein